MILSEKKILDGIREAHFFRDNQAINPGKMIQEVYNPLYKLINFNRSVINSKQDYFNDIRDERANIYREVKEKLHNLDNLSARIHLDNGDEKTLVIRARTNFRPDLTKIPNIIFLRLNDCGSDFVLRESRNYEDNLLVYNDAKNLFKEHYKGDISFEKEKVSKIKDIFSIPEPNLVLSLEDLYYEEKIPRITPCVKVVNVRGKNLCAIRNSLLSISDGHLNASSIIEYQGVLNGLGLMDVLDAQFSHYCLQGDRVVNIDPDFWAYTQSQKHIDNFDWGNFKIRIGKDYLDEGKLIKKLGKKRREVMKSVKDKLAGISLLEKLPAELSKASSLEHLATENAFENLGLNLLIYSSSFPYGL